VGTETTDPAFVHPGTPAGAAALRGRLVTIWVTFLLIGGVVVAGVAFGGPRSRTVTAHGRDLVLEVTYARITRPGIATPLHVTVHRPGGFDARIRIGIERHYLALFDLNSIHPQPLSAMTSGRFVVEEFPPPDGETLAVVFDMLTEPGQQSGGSATVAVLDRAGRPLATAGVHTFVWP
jgi:hypothetical protein